MCAYEFEGAPTTTYQVRFTNGNGTSNNFLLCFALLEVLIEGS